MNTPVSFELAKLLKEKEFDKQCSNFYANPRCKMFGIDEHGRYFPIKNKAKTLWISGNATTLYSRHVYYAPTIADVVMWLYEKHGIWIIAPTHDNNDNYFCYEINFKPSHFLLKVVKNKWSPKEIRFNSPTEAYEAAIEYTLNNLI